MKALFLALVGVAGVHWTGSMASDVSSADRALESLVERALESSPRVERARAAIEGAEAQARQARSGLFPRIGLRERFSSTDQPTAAFGSLLEQGRLDPQRLARIGDPDRVENWAASVSAGMILFDSGRIWNLWGAAREEAERARILGERTSRQIRFDVASGFYGVLRARADREVWEDTIRALEARSRVAGDRAAAGEVLRADVLAIDVRLAEAREGLISAGYAVEIARAELATAVGLPEEQVTPPAVELEAPAYIWDSGAVVLRAVGTHPDVRALERARASAAASLRAARLAALPRLEGELAGHWNGDDERFGLDRESYSAGVILEIPLFEGGRISAERAEAAARLREAEAGLREAELAVGLAATRADRGARAAVARIAVADAGARAAAEALEILSERYESGLVPIEALLEVERDRTQARARGVEARAAARIAVEAVRLVAGVGEGEAQ